MGTSKSKGMNDTQKMTTTGPTNHFHTLSASVGGLYGLGSFGHPSHPLFGRIHRISVKIPANILKSRGARQSKGIKPTIHSRYSYQSSTYRLV
jgi:hypothetical protein